MNFSNPSDRSVCLICGGKSKLCADRRGVFWRCGQCGLEYVGREEPVEEPNGRD